MRAYSIRAMYRKIEPRNILKSSLLPVVILYTKGAPTLLFFALSRRGFLRRLYFFARAAVGATRPIIEVTGRHLPCNPPPPPRQVLPGDKQGPLFPTVLKYLKQTKKNPDATLPTY